MVTVDGAPGFDRFRAEVLNIVKAVDDRGDLAVVADESGELFVVPVSAVHEEGE